MSAGRPVWLRPGAAIIWPQLLPIMRRVRLTSILLASGVAALQSLFVWHTLTQTYPYKIMYAPSAATYAIVGWAGAGCGLALAVGVAVLLSRRFPWVAPLLSSLPVPAVTMILFIVVIGLTSAAPGPHDFTPPEAQAAFFEDLTEIALFFGGLAVLASAALVLAALALRRYGNLGVRNREIGA